MKKIIILLIFLIFVTGCNKEVAESRNFFYMDTYINVKLYDVNNPEKIFAKIDEIYKEYHKLADRYHEYEGLVNVYYLKNINSIDEWFKLDEKLCSMIELGIEYGKKTNGKFNINMAGILDVWKQYRESGKGIPTLEELENAKNKINPIKFVSKCTILNNNPSIDLGAIAKGYATEEVGKYLKENGVNKFIINAGGNVLVGNHYNGNKYKIGLEIPDQSKTIYKVLKLTNNSIVTSGGYERFYTYNAENYHHIIDYNTLFPADLYKSVTVVTPNSALADTLSTSLFLLSIEDGKKLIKDIDAEVIWYTKDDKIIMTEGMKKYE